MLVWVSFLTSVAYSCFFRSLASVVSDSLEGRRAFLYLPFLADEGLHWPFLGPACGSSAPRVFAEFKSPLPFLSLSSLRLPVAVPFPFIFRTHRTALESTVWISLLCFVRGADQVSPTSCARHPLAERSASIKRLRPARTLFQIAAVWPAPFALQACLVPFGCLLRTRLSPFYRSVTH